jgi:cyclase
VYDRIGLQEVSASTLAAVDERLISNIGVVVFSDFIVTLDAGRSPYAARRLREMLEETLRRPVTYACATHYHPDHTAGLSAFKGVGIVGSTRVAQKLRDLPEWCRAELAHWSLDEPGEDGRPGEIEVVVPTLLFDESITIAGDKTLQLRHCGGHSDCSVYGYVADEKVLFAGDLVLVDEFPFAGDATADPETWIATLKAWSILDIAHVIPGHGPVAGPEAIRKQLEFLETLRTNTLAAVKAGKEYTAVTVPDLYCVKEGKQWFVDATLKHWHAYYSGR